MHKINPIIKALLIQRMQDSCSTFREALDFASGFNNIIEADFRPRPAEPTDHMPGTREKVEVMRRRVEAGEECFSRYDRLSY